MRSPLLLLAPLLLAGCLDTDEPTPTVDNGPPLPTPTGDVEADAVATINFYRSQVGLPDVSIASALSDGCRQHASYMALNSVATHEESEDLPGYSEAGAVAGGSSNIASGQDSMVEAVITWISGPYHRFPLLEPGLTFVGAAIDDGYACLDVVQGVQPATDDVPIPYPADGQRGVPLEFPGNETPDPLVNTPYTAPTGYILSLSFPPGTTFGDDILTTVLADGIPQEREAQVAGDPDDPNSGAMRDSIYIVPRDVLTPNTPYEVRVEGTVNDAPFAYSWSFTTAG